MTEVELSRESIRSYVKSRRPCTGCSHKSHAYGSERSEGESLRVGHGSRLLLVGMGARE
jgi:hypothetical protein